MPVCTNYEGYQDFLFKHFCFLYIQSSPERKAHLSSHGIDIPNPGETRWYYKSRAIFTIYNSYDILITALTEISENPQGWTDETITNTDGLLHYLYESFIFCFLLELYHKILEKSTILYSTLQNTSADFAYGIRKIKNFVECLNNELRSDAAFNDCYSAAETKVGAPTRRSERHTNYKQLYFEVIDSIVAMCNERFSDAESFSFLDLVNPKIFNQWKVLCPKKRFCY